MYVATAASAYGPEYYRALLAKPEDDILKPKRTLATQKKYRACTKALEKVYIVINSVSSKLMAWVQILSGNLFKVPGFRG